MWIYSRFWVAELLPDVRGKDGRRRMKSIYYWIMRKLHPKDAWFWTKQWQEKERKVDKEVGGKVYDSIKRAFEDLD